MLTLNDGRNELWQWDTRRTLSVPDDCSQVHFSNKVFGRSIDVDVVDGVAEIPDILLQADKDLIAWAFVGAPENGYTKISKVFKVNRRNKPADYVFTPPEQTTLGEILERLDDIESAQDPDAIKNAVEDYLDNNPIHVEETDPTVPNWAKQPTKPQYTAAEVGALPDTYTPPAAPVQSVNGKTGAVNLTAEDVGALPANTEIPLPGITEETDPTVQNWAKTSIHAAVGQYFKVSAVDKNGNVTAVEAVDAPSGGGDEWEKVASVTLEEAVSQVDISADVNGNTFRVNQFIIHIVSPANDYKELWAKATYNSNGAMTSIAYISSQGRNTVISMLKFGDVALSRFNSAADATSETNLKGYAGNAAIEYSHFRFWRKESDPFPVGTKFEIHGVRA